jgi:hypothetical protein
MINSEDLSLAFLDTSLKNLPSPPREGSCEKFGIYPLTLPSPTRGEGKHIEIRKKFPPPLKGGGDYSENLKYFWLDLKRRKL